MPILKKFAASFLLAATSVFGLSAPAFSGETPTLEQMKKEYRRPAGVPFPADNPFSVEKLRLGQQLYFDPRLSGSGSISCASCHNPGLSWGDGLAKGIGAGGTLGRRSPTILNLAWADLLMWDGRKTSLEDQALGPVESDMEMNQKLGDLVPKLARIDGYRTAFEQSFPGEGITLANVAKAIATYERTVVSTTAPFDRWIAGDEKAISESAKRGFEVFNTKGNCASCHSGWNLTDHGFHDIGLPDEDVGRAKILPLDSMKHAFKTPTLRDVARRAPYMHDGSLADLAAVVDHYDKGGAARPSLAAEMKPLNLTAAEKNDLIAFMLTLTGESEPVQVPPLAVPAQAPSF
ncbi:cytochrome-c peroxidase [Azospirillum sp. sgz302134]